MNIETDLLEQWSKANAGTVSQILVLRWIQEYPGLYEDGVSNGRPVIIAVFSQEHVHQQFRQIALTLAQGNTTLAQAGHIIRILSI